MPTFPPSSIRTTKELAGFDYQPRTRLVFGAGSVDRVGELVGGLGVSQVLLVTDPGIVAAGHATHVRESLKAAGLQIGLFEQVKENPTTRCVENCVTVAQAAGVDVIVGLGGGSAMDTAKGCNFILTNGGRMLDYWGVGKATKPMLPFIAIPTTAGTGSEMQCAALITDEQTHQKMACLDPKCSARIAILDPLLTLSQPPRVAACTGVDAIAHAVETAVTTKRNTISQMFSREAFRLCIGAFPRMLAKPDDLEARADMQLGAAFAGAAIENSMLGAAHAAANPLTAHFGISHGHAVGLMLPHVVRFNAAGESSAATYAQLAMQAGIGAAADELAKRLGQLLDIAGLPGNLASCNVRLGNIPALAAEAAQQWTANFNPRPVTAADFVHLYTEALNAR